MPSPFPGMDPYLEDPAFWPDFHVRFINYWCEALADRLPDNYEARIDKQVRLVEIPADEARRYRPDVAVTRHGPPAGLAAAPAGVLTLEPVTLPLPVTEEVRDARIELLQRPERTLVAVLALLSSSNKTGDGRGEYLAKRRALLRQPVHLVELDLLVGGQRLPTGLPLPSGEYFALVARAEERPHCKVFAWSLRQSLPAIPVPLRAPDLDVVVDLAAVFALAYERGRYTRSINYRVDPAAPLQMDQLRWAAERTSAVHRDA